MFELLKNKVRIIAATSLLSAYDTEELDAGKRFIAILAGAYIFQKGVRAISKHPVVGIQEAVLGGILLYTGTVGIHKKIVRKPTDHADIRRNQIQGNDPRSAVPAFV
ncbi:hypothetical protein [Pedobacter gandavensis]|uniref:Uncharacterized protein n=1 Tax=Pedobacter gandavensis TaxID=2679963 RepID=A0ABR6ESC6_9SPHI|nr:hypothetical protein [Pedobacter gandavensis]MBB2147886.1 hypothetical protein [Pedobacter gandavensis]